MATGGAGSSAWRWQPKGAAGSAGHRQLRQVWQVHHYKADAQTQLWTYAWGRSAVGVPPQHFRVNLPIHTVEVRFWFPLEVERAPLPKMVPLEKPKEASAPTQNQN